MFLIIFTYNNVLIMFNNVYTAIENYPLFWEELIIFIFIYY